MRILLVSYEYPPVGAGAATAGGAIAKALTELGHRIIVLTGRFKGLPPRYEDQGIIIHRIPSLRRRMDRSHVLEMASFLADGYADFPTSFPCAAEMSLAPNLRLIFSTVSCVPYAVQS